jgi:hypothetical protein
MQTQRDQPARPERRSGDRRGRPRRSERRQRAGDGFAEAPAAERRPLLKAPPATATSHGACDPAVEKVRRAGGPLDEAVYTCACGYLFSAAVSTTVRCPHCGTGQAW